MDVERGATAEVFAAQTGSDHKEREKFAKACDPFLADRRSIVVGRHDRGTHMDSTQDNIIIIGGGIAGSGLASVLASAGLDVTSLERTTTFPDRVRGEMYTPWGVKIAEEIGLLEPLLDAGATFTTDWVFYDAAFPAEVAESLAVDASAIVEGVPGILNFTHPAACQALHDHASAAGATMVRGVMDIDVDLSGPRPVVRWTLDDGTTHERSAALVVGADGRASQVRRAAGIELHLSLIHI